MNWGAIGAVGEIIGGVAVLATLVYLAIQVKLSNENAKADVEAMLGHWMSENNRAMTLSGDMIEVIEKGMSDVATLSDVDRR